MTHLLAVLTVVVSDWPTFLLILTAFGLVLGAVGHLLSVIPWAPAKALGQTINGLYSHWGDFLAGLTNLVKSLAGLLPKGPSGGAVGVFVMVLCIPITTGCNGTVAKEVLGAVDVALAQGSWGSDLTLWIEQVVAAEAEHFAASPDAVSQAAFDLEIDDLRLKAQKAIQDTASSKGPTLAELQSDYAPAAAAALKVADDARKLGLFKSALPPTMPAAASSRALSVEASKPDEPPLPLCVRNAKGNS